MHLRGMPNRLIHEQSPYLLQHAHNPVDWFPWGDEAFKLAKVQHKPVLVSIGYAACHWCHVMERESFESEAVAAFMNEHFICIKVDREEHPDVDHLYMDAVQAMSGSGGWPLNAFVTPDRIPFYGGTYFPPAQVYNRPSWMDVLARISNIWETQQDEVSAQSEQMLTYLRQTSEMSIKRGDIWDKPANNKLAESLLAMADKEWGGFGNAPKFPGTMAINYLLERYHYTGDEASLKQALLSLDKMIAGGIYDQLNGGFARYSTDKFWLAPHFEKMLYDNALILLSLCDAYVLTKGDRYKKVIEETIAFVNRELRDTSGGFYSALDADSEGVEGKFYTWTWAEWEALFPEGNHVGEVYFGIQQHGNWEETNILHEAKSFGETATETGCSIEEVKQQIEVMKEVLRKDQESRVRPHTDDKCLLSWNALMNLALTRSGVVLQQPAYLLQATRHLQWMLDTFYLESGLKHTWKTGDARIIAKLDDHAYLIQAMLQLGSATSRHQLIKQASVMVRYVQEHFAGPQQLFYRFTSDEQHDIPVPKTDVYDGATPSANAVMAHNLLLAGLAMEEYAWTEQGQQMLNTISQTALRYPYSFGYWATLLQRQIAGFKLAVVTGNEAAGYHNEFLLHFLPEVFFLKQEEVEEFLPITADKKVSGGTGIFVCTVQECLPPETSVQAALQLFNTNY